MGASILFVGDIHLGRRPSRLPEGLEAWGLSAADLTPAAAWNAVVDYARTEGVDAVVLAGDVVEADNAIFEAYGKLQPGVFKLIEHDIQVFAVAGNHDVVALPRLADEIEGFRLLGRGGRWEKATVLHRGKPAAHLVGWSFPAANFNSNPLKSGTFPEMPGDGLPVFGVVHCDVDGGSSPYAPVPLGEFKHSKPDGWFLGHLHNPWNFERKRPIGYLGSLVGLDPTEAGFHGPWLLRMGEEERFSIEHIPLAPLRWERVTVPVGGMESTAELLGLVTGRLEELHRQLAPELGKARAVGCRLELTGAVTDYKALRDEIENQGVAGFQTTYEGIAYFVDKVLDHSRPALDLERLAGDADPPALLAGMLLSLEKGSEESKDMVARAKQELVRTARDTYTTLPEPIELDDDRVRELLISSGMQALERLLQQVASPSGGEDAA